MHEESANTPNSRACGMCWRTEIVVWMIFTVLQVSQKDVQHKRLAGAKCTYDS